MTLEVLINGQPATAIAFNDRGLAYGDGVFETVRVAAGALPLWSYHLERLCAGAQRLQLPLEAALQHQLTREVRQLAGSRGNAVIKVILTRGAGGRGYAPPAAIEPTRIVAVFPWQPRAVAEGVTVRVCQTRLAIQPLLAGLKHLNRLEQVLARSEWQEPAIAEGLMLDMEDQVIEGTMSNLMLVRAGRLLTPRLDRCGVAGVMRRYILAQAPAWGLTAEEQRLTLADVAAADELFLCNSVQGVWPVTCVTQACGETWHYNVGAITQRIHAEVQALWNRGATCE